MRTHLTTSDRTNSPSRNPQQPTSSLKPRPFNNPEEEATAQAEQTTTTDLQTQLEHGRKSNNLLSRVPILQPKLSVGEPNDQYEQEADRVASQVMAMAAPPQQPNIQRQTVIEEEELQTKPLASTITPLVQRQTIEEEELQTKPIQRREGDSGNAGASVESQLNSTKGSGSPLSDEVRSFMEPRFGADLSQVRVHTGDTAVQMNRELGAQAFTHGHDIYYGNGKAPSKDDLTAHELTHVLQQTGAVQCKATIDPDQTEQSITPAAYGTVQGDWLDDAADWVGDQAESASDWAGEKASQASDWASETYDDAADWAGEKVDQASDWASETYDDAADWAGEKVDQASDWVSETYDDATDWASEKYNQASEWVEEKANSASEWVEETVDDVEDWVDEKVDEATDAFEDASDWVSEKANEAEEWIKEEVNSAKETVAQAIDDAIDWAKEKYNAAEAWVDDAINKGKQVLNDVKQKVAKLIAELKKKIFGKGGGPSTEDDKTRFAEIEKILKTIPTGQEALKLMDQYGVGVKFKPGGGSYYDSGTNSMVIDSTESAEDAALTFVHEMNHARYHHESKTADPKKLPRDEYVKGMVEEEAEGTVKSIEAKIELEEGGTIDVSKASFPLEKEYREAYKAAVEAAKASDPSLSEEELKKIGRTAGKQRVTKGFMDGEVVTSNTKESYPDYYGKAWDKINKP